MDFNVQQDTRAAEIVAATADLTLVRCPSRSRRSCAPPTCRAFVPLGPLGELLASQGDAHGRDFQMAEMGRLHASLPDDLLNFHYDPVACAVALGWPGASVAETRLQLVPTASSCGSARDDRTADADGTDLDSGSFTGTG